MGITTPDKNEPEGSLTDENSSPPTLAALNWARALQLIQKHGFTGLIVVVLAYQLGWLASAQSNMCGV